MSKNSYRISFFLVACTLLISLFPITVCEEDDSKPVMEDLTQLRHRSRELADTHSGDFSNQKKLAVSIKKTSPTPSGGGGSTPRTPGSTPRTPGSTPRTPVSTPRTPGSTPRTPGSTPRTPGSTPPGGGSGSPPGGGGGSRPVIVPGGDGRSGSNSGGSRSSLSFNGGWVLSVVIFVLSF